MQALFPVRVRDCACPGTPHEDGDTVSMTPTLDLEGGLIAEQQMLANYQDTPVLTRLWMDTFVRYGAKGWNLIDEQGEPVPFDVELILADYAIARPVANWASDRGWGNLVMAPFLQALDKQSPTGRTAATTSARPARTRSRSGSRSQRDSAVSLP